MIWLPRIYNSNHTSISLLPKILKVSSCTTQHVPVRRRKGEIYYGMDKELERPFGKAVVSVWLFILLFVVLIIF